MDERFLDIEGFEVMADCSIVIPRPLVDVWVVHEADGDDPDHRVLRRLPDGAGHQCATRVRAPDGQMVTVEAWHLVVPMKETVHLMTQEFGESRRHMRYLDHRRGTLVRSTWSFRLAPHAVWAPPKQVRRLRREYTRDEKRLLRELRDDVVRARPR